jgi:hypothetical protein
MSADPAMRRHWVHLGRDGAMEERLLSMILNEAGV